jgi:hypothetical protein
VVNASTPALTREGEVQSKIGKVRAFSRIARFVCSAIFGFGLVACVFLVLINVLGMFLPEVGNITGFTPEQRLGVLPFILLIAGIWLAAVFQLYRLFGNLAAGAIYTPENVRRLRNVGFLWLLLAALGILIPIASATLLSFGFTVPEGGPAFSWQETLSSFISAGLILLISWVLDVGLYEKDHADALQRDADLVI